MGRQPLALAEKGLVCSESAMHRASWVPHRQELRLGLAPLGQVCVPARGQRLPGGVTVSRACEQESAQRAASPRRAQGPAAAATLGWSCASAL